MAHDGQLAVAVGLDSLIACSSDGVEWHVFPAPLAADFRDVVHHADNFIAVGNQGKAATSRTGTFWTEADTGTDKDLVALAAGDGYVLAVGQAGTLLRTREGTVWESLPFPSPLDCRDIAFGDGRFVVVAHSLVFCSPDAGQTWIVQSDRTSDFRSVAYGNGVFLVATASGEHFLSRDGQTWFVGGENVTDANSLLFAKGAFLGLMPYGHRELELSLDGQQWTCLLPSGPAVHLSSAAMRAGLEFNGTVLMGGDQGVIYQFGEPRWTAPPIALACPTASLDQPAPGDTVSITVNAPLGELFRRVLLEVNGRPLAEWTAAPFVQDWTPASAGRYELVARAETQDGRWAIGAPLVFDVTFPNPVAGPAPTPLPSGNPLAYGGGVFVMGVSEGVWVFPDGAHWSQHPLDAELSALVHDGTRFVGVGHDVTGTSADGFYWTLQNLSTPMSLADLAFDGARYVAVGAGGVSLTSTDARNWLPLPGVTREKLVRVVAGPGGFLALDATGAWFLNSTEEAWQPIGLPGGWGVTGLASNGRTWLAQDEKGVVYSSVNARDWTRHVSGPCNGPLRFLTGLNGGFLAVAADGQVRSSEEGTRWVTNFALTESEILAAVGDKALLMVVGGVPQQLVLASAAPAEVPRCRLVAPAPGEVLDGLSPMHVEVVSEPAEATIRRLELWIDGNLVATTDSPALTATWTPLRYGIHHLTALAEDNLGQWAVSDTILVEALETFDLWLQRFFDDAERQRSELVGPEADPDGDGMANIREFVHALDPRRPEAPGDALFAGWFFDADGTPFLTLTARQGPTSLAIRREVTYGESLGQADGSWQTAAKVGVPELVDEGVFQTRWRAPVPPLSSAGFLRYRVFGSPPPGE